MRQKNVNLNGAQHEKESSDKERKPGKSAHMKRGGNTDSSGGSRQGNAGQEGGDEGSFGNR